MPTILIIDDRTDSWDLLENKLSGPKFEDYIIIGKLLDGEGLKDYFNKKLIPPDIVFLDKQFHGDRVAGEVIASKIKQLSPETKIVMMTEFQDRLDFISFHSSNLIDGYIKKQNILDENVLHFVLLSAKMNNNFFDVPPDWLDYEQNDDLDRLKAKFAQKRNLEIDKIPEDDFKQFRRDERLRLKVRLTDTEWEIFKRTALGFCSQEMEEPALNTHMSNIRDKLNVPFIKGSKEIRNRNKFWFLAKAVELRVPEIINNLSNLTGADIRFPE